MHDPLADPLSPYWRAKVNAALRGTARPVVASSPPGLRTMAARRRAEKLLIALWPTGARARVIARHLGCGERAVARMLRELRAAGHDLPYRERHYRPPADYAARVDAVLEQFEGLRKGVGGPDS